jgi:8-oxo-dGTP pyrophosphatase MutT (NUDIX family)
MRRSEAAVALIRRQQDGQTCWLAQWNAKWQRFHFISGHRRPDETFRACLVREVAEELGLQESRDYVIAAGPPMPLEFTAWSESAQTETAYHMELFEVELTGVEARRTVDADPQNRWLSEPEIRAERGHDGRPISPTMARVLDAVGSHWKRRCGAGDEPLS